MNDAPLIPGLLAITLIALGVCVMLVVRVWREMNAAPGDAEDETRSERWSDEEMHDAKRRQAASRWLEKEDVR